MIRVLFEITMLVLVINFGLSHLDMVSTNTKHFDQANNWVRIRPNPDDT